jgi:hypothetical protein
VDGDWVFGLTEKIDESRADTRMFLVQKRDRDTLRPIIEQCCADGSIIVSDEWRAYRGLDNWGHSYRHETVNHSEEFINQDTGAHTQNIEREWKTVKSKVVKRRNGFKNGDEMRGLLAEHWFRRLNGPDLFYPILDAIRNQYAV